MAVFLLAAAIVFFLLAGLNVRRPHFEPEWFGLACLVAAYAWPSLTR